MKDRSLEDVRVQSLSDFIRGMRVVLSDQKFIDADFIHRIMDEEN